MIMVEGLLFSLSFQLCSSARSAVIMKYIYYPDEIKLFGSGPILGITGRSRL